MLDSFAPQVVWGLFPRLLGVVYFIAIGSLFGQVLPLAGSQGISPIRLQLRKIRQDYPAARRFVYFPTLLWLNAEDWFLRALIVVGAGASLLVVLGGALSGWALLVCWLVYLSFDVAMGLYFPWDCLLLEAGFLAIFLPPLNLLPALTTTASPLPTLAWAFRWLLFRLVFGFGKFKFLGMHRKEIGYLKGFLINQPMPTPLGWYAHHLPTWLHKAGLAYLFLVEMILSFLILIPGDTRILVAAAICFLMVGIQLTGNYGFFNVLVITLCVTLLDRSATVFDVLKQPLSLLIYPPGNLLTNTVILIVAIGGLLYLPFNSWCTQSWLHWPSLLQVRSRWFQRLIAFYRALARFRIVHAYGVFLPISGPPVKWIPIIEGTQDGKVWQEYRYHLTPSGPSSPPRFVSPYHPRFEYKLFYEGFGGDVASFLESTFGVGNPYDFSHSSAMQRLVQRLLEGGSSVKELFGYNPFPDTPPTAIRVSCYMFTPTSNAERIRTGAWWRREYVGPHLPPTQLDGVVWERWLSDPEQFHWDEIIWKRRSSRIATLLRLAATHDDLSEVLLAGSTDFTAEDIRCFWEDFVVLAGQADQKNFEDLPKVVERLRQRYSRAEWRAFELIQGRLALILYSRLEPYFWETQTLKLKLNTFFHLGLLIYHIIGEGREACENVFREPANASGFIGDNTPQSGLFCLGVFWLDTLVYNARKLRITERYIVLEYVPGTSGFLALTPFMTHQFEVPGEEHLPSFARKISDGEWFRAED